MGWFCWVHSGFYAEIDTRSDDRRKTAIVGLTLDSADSFLSHDVILTGQPGFMRISHIFFVLLLQNIKY